MAAINAVAERLPAPGSTKEKAPSLKKLIECGYVRLVYDEKADAFYPQVIHQ